MKAVILDYDTLAPQDLNLEALWALPFDWQTFTATTAAETRSRLSGFSIVCTNKVQITREHMLAHDSLKLIVIMATGTNNVDLEAAREMAIPVCNIVDYSTPSVVQHTIALMLALSTRLIDYSGDVQRGEWQKSKFFGLLNHQVQELAGKTLGIVGYGAIGKGVAKAAESLGMKVLIAQSLSNNGANTEDASHRLPLADLLAQIDVLSLHCPLSDQSRNLIDAAALARLKPNAIVINVSRGGIIDENALLYALRNKQLAGAALDVLAQEPPQGDHPLLSAKVANLIITPHSAWASQQSRQRLIDQMVGIFRQFLDNTQLSNRVS